MKEISINNIKEGMLLGEDIVTTSGIVLLSKGTEFTETLILKVKNLSITKVIITVDSIINNNKPKSIEEEIENSFQQVFEIVKSGILDLNLEKSVIIENTETVTKLIKKNFSQHTMQIFNSILNVREKDEYLYRHSIHVSTISYLIGRWLDYDEKKLTRLMKAALLHDIGKLKISRELLDKPGKLNEEEFNEIKKHSVHTYEILKNFEIIDKEMLSATIMHHEKLDGSGYPLGLKGMQINEFARIISIADIFDAMTSDRVYHKKKLPFEVINMFEKDCFGSIDYKISKLFSTRLLECYIGANIKLNNGAVARIIKINSDCSTKPLILTEKGELIDLSIQESLKIEQMYS